MAAAIYYSAEWSSCKSSYKLAENRPPKILSRTVTLCSLTHVRFGRSRYQGSKFVEGFYFLTNRIKRESRGPQRAPGASSYSVALMN